MKAVKHSLYKAGDFTEQRTLTRAIAEAGGSLDPVYTGMAKHLPTAIQKFTAEDVARVTQYEGVGWRGSRFIAPGRLDDNEQINLASKLPYDATEGNVAKALEALGALLEATSDAGHAAIVLASILQAPLARRVGWGNERYATIITGRTGSLKTSFAQCAMSIFGAGFINDQNLIKLGEGATRNAVMAYATQAGDMPLLIDNYKPNTSGGAVGFVALIHNILEGGNKDRLTRQSVLTEGGAVHCMPIFTGEDVPDDDPATIARMIVVPFSRGDGVNEQLAKAQRMVKHLQTIGAMWLDYLEEGVNLPSGAFEKQRAEWASHLATFGRGQNILRMATNLTTNQLTLYLASQHPILGKVITPELLDAQYWALGDVASRMITTTDEGLESVRFVSRLAELLSTGRVRLETWGDTPEGGAVEVVGWRDDNGTYIIPATAREQIRRHTGDTLNGISQTMLTRQLNETGKATSKIGRPFTGASSIRLYHFTEL